MMMTVSVGIEIIHAVNSLKKPSLTWILGLGKLFRGQSTQRGPRCIRIEGTDTCTRSTPAACRLPHRTRHIHTIQGSSRGTGVVPHVGSWSDVHGLAVQASRFNAAQPNKMVSPWIHVWGNTMVGDLLLLILVAVFAPHRQSLSSFIDTHPRFSFAVFRRFALAGLVTRSYIPSCHCKDSCPP